MIVGHGIAGDVTFHDSDRDVAARGLGMMVTGPRRLGRMRMGIGRLET
jgi:hypothetical protein